MNKYFIGIDASLTNTGVVVLDSDCKLAEVAQSNTLKLKSAEPLERLIHLSSFLDSIVKKYTGCITAAYEDYSYNSTNKAFLLGELGGVLKTTLYLRVHKLVLAPPTMVKSFAVNHGHADKELLIAQALEECPELNKVKKLSSDICDAFFLAKIAMFVDDKDAAMKSGTWHTRKRMEIAFENKYKTFQKGD